MSENYLERVGQVNAEISAENEIAAHRSPSRAEATGIWMDDVSSTDPDSQASVLSSVPALWRILKVLTFPLSDVPWVVETSQMLSESDPDRWPTPGSVDVTAIWDEAMTAPDAEPAAAIAWEVPSVQAAAMTYASQVAEHQGFEAPSTLAQARMVFNAAQAAEMDGLTVAWLRSLPSQPFYVSAGIPPTTN